MADDFSDEEWDIPDEELRLLERNAIVSTQGQGLHNAAKSGPANGRPGLRNEKSGTNNHTATNGVGHQSHARERGLPSAESSFDLNLDEDGIPLVVEEPPRPLHPRAVRDEKRERESWRAARFGQTTAVAQPAGVKVHGVRSTHQDVHQPTDSRPQKHGTVDQHIDMQDLSSKASAAQASMNDMLEQIRREKEVLEEALNRANEELQTARGEIAVIRTRNTGDVKSVERQMGVLTKQIQEESAKHQMSLQAKDHAYTQLVSDTKFLKQELAEQNRTIHILQRRLKEPPSRSKPAEPNTTPKKVNKYSLNDGFAEDDVMILSPGRSPSKLQKNSKPGTPSNRKRKQQAPTGIDVQPLPLRLTGEPQLPENGITEERTLLHQDPEKAAGKGHIAEQQLRFLPQVLSFKPRSGTGTIIDGLAAHTFPSRSDMPLGRRLLEELSELSGSNLARDTLGIVITLLGQVVSEKSYGPLPILLDLIEHIFNLEPTVISTEIIDRILPPLDVLIQINPTLRWIASDRMKTWTEDDPKPLLRPEIDTTRCLQVIYTMAILISDEADLITHFWRSVDTDLVLAILAPSQQPDDILIMLELLQTSVLTSTFANICEPAKQAQMEFYILDKITSMLSNALRPYEPPSKPPPFPRNHPLPDPIPPPYPDQVIYNVRLMATELLVKLAVTSLPHPHSANKALVSTHHGTSILVSHPNAIARLVRCLYDEVEFLYQPLPTRDLHAEVINRVTTILHHLLTAPQAASLDLAKKLSQVPAGVHKFRVAFTRVAFRDNTVLDCAISERAGEMATEVLEEYVTPDEALALLEAFGKHSLDDDVEEEEEKEAHSFVDKG